jgi:hypothetical protein
MFACRFDDCFKLGKRIDETPYLLPDPEILNPLPEEDVRVPSRQEDYAIRRSVH